MTIYIGSNGFLTKEPNGAPLSLVQMYDFIKQAYYLGNKLNLIASHRGIFGSEISIAKDAIERILPTCNAPKTEAGLNDVLALFEPVAQGLKQAPVRAAYESIETHLPGAITHALEAWEIMGFSNPLQAVAQVVQNYAAKYNVSAMLPE